MDKRLQAQEKQAQLAQNDGPENIAERVNQILEQALRQRASDIHIEPTETHLRIRLRVDGVLHALPLLAPELAAPVIARLKVLASLDIAEHRLPQDGQFALNLAGRPLSFRIATLPCRYGEKIVLRLLHQVDQALDLEALGLSSSQLAAFRQALNQPQGLLLVTGPTGSGKTVTLYSALQARNREQVNICSVEDPLEIPIAGMNQTQIIPAPDSLFTVCCAPCYARIRILSWWARSAMPRPLKSRSKPPDRSSVLSTLHTNSTSETLTRLQQMGIARWMIPLRSRWSSPSVWSQAVSHCRRNAGSAADLPHSLWPRPLPRWQAAGCEHCYHGYYGRLALFEVLPVTPGLRQGIVQGLNAIEIESLARAAGMMTLFESGCQAIEQGLTSLEEVVRVLGSPMATKRLWRWRGIDVQAPPVRDAMANQASGGPAAPSTAASHTLAVRRCAVKQSLWHPRYSCETIRQLASLLQAGLPLAEGLSLLAQQQSHAQWQALLEALGRELAQGVAFSAALAQWPRLFRPYIWR
ncbi:type IV fimbrial assembly, ATPase PilB [Klebsiella pneumoniae]|uniref:Type IV fimbrial assembly, ATPase PilB n=3 Tax=Enterobacteriaceae TaxID=543 RepID=A0A377UTP9_KLEPN|nr:type IV fimbrial assembly, ATPase PilB [Klebsiella pneumoniae]